MSRASAEIDTSEEKPLKSVRIRWYLIALLVIGGIINYLDRNNLSIANTTIAEEFGLNTTADGAAAFRVLLAVCDCEPSRRLPR